MNSITEIRQQVVINYVDQSAEVLVLFDCAITLSQEVDAIWSRKLTATTCLYALTRYSTIIQPIVLMIPHWNFVYFDQALELLQLLCLAWFSTLRVYALLDGKYFLASIVLLLNLVPFATNMVQVQRYMPDSLFLPLSLITRISVIIGDVLVLAVTWTKTAHAYREARRFGVKAPLVVLLFRDGTIHFLILLVTNVLQIINENAPGVDTLNVIGPFSNFLPLMIVYRFILNLRQIELVEGSRIGSQSDSLRFVGNMGQPLQFGGDSAGGEEDSMPGAEVVFAQADLSPENVDANGECISNRQGSEPELEMLDSEGRAHIDFDV